MTPIDRERLERLTKRQREAVTLLSIGANYHEIGRLMGVSRRTSEQHIIDAYRVLKIHSRVRVARFAIRVGLTSA